jgi:hypothetical protein
MKISNMLANIETSLPVMFGHRCLMAVEEGQDGEIVGVLGLCMPVIAIGAILSGQQ